MATAAMRPSRAFADSRGQESEASQPRTAATPQRATAPPGPRTARPAIKSATSTSGATHVGSWWRKSRGLALRRSAACRAGDAPGVYRLSPFGRGLTRCLVGRLLTPVVPSAVCPGRPVVITTVVITTVMMTGRPPPTLPPVSARLSPGGHGKSCDGPSGLPLSWQHRRPPFRRASRTSTAGRRPPAGWRTRWHDAAIAWKPS
jgi:hypothetical protein